MEAALRLFRLSHLMESAIGFLFEKTSQWVRRYFPARWEKVVIPQLPIRPVPTSPSLQTLPKAFKQAGIESLSYSGSSDDMESRDAGPILDRGVMELLPARKWTLEIQPFLLNQLSPHTRRAYETDLKQFLEFLESKADLDDLDRLRPQHIMLFRKYMEEGRLTGKPLEKATINRKLAVIKSFFNWLRVNHVVRENPAELVKGYPQTQESSLKGLSDEEARKILELPKRNSRSGALHLAILNVLLHLGLRKQELISLKMGDLDSERGVPVIKVRGKGHRVRVLPITAVVQGTLEHYFFACQRDRGQTEEPLFTPTKNPWTGVVAKSLNPNAITYIVKKYAKKAGILKPISPHSCRATCISHALDKKATHRSVQHLAGWTTPLMIQRYDKRREDLQNSAAFLIDYGEAQVLK